MKDDIKITARNKEEFDLIHKIISQLPEKVSNQIESASFNESADEDEIHIWCDFKIKGIGICLPNTIYTLCHTESEDKDYQHHIIAHSKNISFCIDCNNYPDIDFLEHKNFN